MIESYVSVLSSESKAYSSISVEWFLNDWVLGLGLVPDTLYQFFQKYFIKINEWI